MNKKYIVQLTAEERETLHHLIASGKGSARLLTHARILLKADSALGGDNWPDALISSALDVSCSTIVRVRQRFVCEDLSEALHRQTHRNSRPRCLDGVTEAHLIAIACSEPPQGSKHWTLRLLAERMVELNYIERLSYETVRRTLKKTNLNLTSRSVGAFPPSKTPASSGRWKMS